MTGQKRKFALPLMQNAASSPINLGGDPIVRPKEGPINRNAARNSRFIFSCPRLRNFNMFVQGANIPGISLGEANQFTPFTDVPVPGDKLIFNPLIVRFVVDEDFENYLEIQRWMRGCAFPEGHNENDALLKGLRQKETADASLSIMTNGGAFEAARVHFVGIWPTALEDLDLASSGMDNEIQSTVTWRYAFYRVETFPEGFPTK